MKLVEDVCELFRVPYYREQSRTFDVVSKGHASGFRPMFVGGWRDRFGQDHDGGRPDFLLTPRIRLPLIERTAKSPDAPQVLAVLDTLRIAETVPLWVECKAGSDRLSPKQELFRDDIRARGAGYWLLVKDGPGALLEWFERHGVTKD